MKKGTVRVITVLVMAIALFVGWVACHKPRTRGIESFTTFATWMLHQRYFELHGQDEAVKAIYEYSSLLKQASPQKERKNQ